MTSPDVIKRKWEKKKLKKDESGSGMSKLSFFTSYFPFLLFPFTSYLHISTSHCASNPFWFDNATVRRRGEKKWKGSGSEHKMKSLRKISFWISFCYARFQIPFHKRKTNRILIPESTWNLSICDLLSFSYSISFPYHISISPTLSLTNLNKGFNFVFWD